MATLNDLCDELLLLILPSLPDPSPLTLVSKRLYKFSQDPYVRAHYFLARHGPVQAVYHALGHGRIMTERVIDILLSSGAQLSRYLVQLAMHHYFYTQTSHFIKSPWVRSIPLGVFAYLLKVAAEKYGEIPRGKGEDDGSIFASFLKESRAPAHLKQVNWETVKDILEKYKFMPFSHKDPIMVQFPVALAIEPRLLPYAVANGFYMDSKYRDFIFRKIFERPPSGSETGMQDIVQNVTELCRLDGTMFVSRTVAAEVCMEAKSNDVAYAALKQLNKSGLLLFDLSTLVEDLLKLFLKTRSLTLSNTNLILRHLFTDFPSSDPTVRLVMLLTVFVSPDPPHTTNINTIKTRLEALNLGPVTKGDLYNLLINPFMERQNILLEYMKTEGEGKGLSSKEVRGVLEEVAGRCLEIECKGKMLRKLHDAFPSIHQALVRTVSSKYQIELEDLPAEEEVSACYRYRAKLCRSLYAKPVGDAEYFWEGVPKREQQGEVDGSPVEEEIDADDFEEENENEGEREESRRDVRRLGAIGQETLSTMIRQDELLPSRSRRRPFWPYGAIIEPFSGSHLPVDPVQVGKWIKSEFGPRSSVTAVFMTHAVLNDNTPILRHYLMDMLQHDVSTHVPVTLKHFQLLARLGKSPNYYLFNDIQLGAEFFRSENDYISTSDKAKKLGSKVKVKTETTHHSIPSSSGTGPSTPSTPRGTKRPRRSVAANVSYAVPDSDDDDDMEEELPETKDGRIESHLQMWIKSLGELLRIEQAKHREKKKRLEREAEPGVKLRVNKNEFFKSLSSHLRLLRKHDAERRAVNHDVGGGDEDSDADDDDYLHRKNSSSKKRKTTRG